MKGETKAKKWEFCSKMFEKLISRSFDTSFVTLKAQINRQNEKLIAEDSSSSFVDQMYIKCAKDIFIKWIDGCCGVFQKYVEQIENSLTMLQWNLGISRIQLQKNPRNSYP